MKKCSDYHEFSPLCLMCDIPKKVPCMKVLCPDCQNSVGNFVEETIHGGGGTTARYKCEQCGYEWEVEY